MPWPMIHFSIAYQLFENPTPIFLLGSIAPDAVLVRGNDKEGKLRSHLGRHSETEDFLEFIRGNIISAEVDGNYSQFLLGYIAHIYADLKWSIIKKSISGHDHSLREQLWQEENQTDFNIYKDISWKGQLKSDIMRSPLYDLKGIYTSSELDRWRSSIFEWLDQVENEPKIKNQFLTIERIENFIMQTSEELKELLKNLLMQLEEGRNIS
jgi:hypothetical protein